MDSSLQVPVNMELGVIPNLIRSGQVRVCLTNKVIGTKGTHLVQIRKKHDCPQPVSHTPTVRNPPTNAPKNSPL